jgi:hypothetical protein
MPPRRGRGQARRPAQRPPAKPSPTDETPQQGTATAAPRELTIPQRRALTQHYEQQYHRQMKQRLSQVDEPKRGDRDYTPEIRGFSSQVLDQMDMLEQERERLAPTINEGLEVTYTELRVKRDMVYWRIFRINELPTEILANIFRYVVWSSPKPNVGVKLRLWITWVCRHWRRIAISDFTLWNAIWIRDLPPHEQSLTWFERAGTAPLDIRINERDATWGGVEDQHAYTGEQMEWLLDRLMPKMSQVRMFIVIVDTWPPALVVLDKLRQAGAAGVQFNIERFELHRAGTPYVWIGPGFRPDVHRNPIPLFGGQNVTTLHYVCLNGINVDWPNSSLLNLTTIDIRRLALEASPSLHDFREMLKKSPNLLKLALDGAGPSWDHTDMVGLRPIELPRLRILIFGNFSLSYVSYVIANISAPHVLDLTLADMNGEDYTPFISLITPIFREVRILTLYTFEVDHTPQNLVIFSKWLESMPDLSYLRMAQLNRRMLDAFLQMTYLYDDSAGPIASTSTAVLPRQIVCPKLNIIEYQNIVTADIVEFGQKRRALGAPLRKIYINRPWVTAITAQEQAELRTLCDLYITSEGATTEEEAKLMTIPGESGPLI